MQPVNDRRPNYSGLKRPYFRPHVNYELLHYVYSAWLNVRRDLENHEPDRNVQYFSTRTKDERLVGFVPISLPDYWSKRMLARNYENRRT